MILVAVSHCAGHLVEENITSSASTRLFATRLERRLGCLSPAPSEVHSARLFAAPGQAVVDVGLICLVQKPNCWVTSTQTKWPENQIHIRFRTRSLFQFARMRFVFDWKIDLAKIWSSKSDSHKNHPKGSQFVNFSSPEKIANCCVAFTYLEKNLENLQGKKERILTGKSESLGRKVLRYKRPL